MPASREPIARAARFQQMRHSAPTRCRIAEIDGDARPFADGGLRDSCAIVGARAWPQTKANSVYAEGCVVRVGPVRNLLQTPALAPDGAAKESNLPSVGLPRPAGFEDQMSHQAPATPSPG